MSAERRLLARLEKMQSEGMIGFNIFPGDKWNECTREERCQAILDALDAPPKQRGTPKCRQQKTDIRTLVAGL